LVSLCLSGFQSIHKHGECHSVGVAHPDDVRLSVRIGARPSGSVLSCGYGRGPHLRPGSVLAPQPRCRASMRLGFILVPLSGFSIH
jgi:hypothetical protein